MIAATRDARPRTRVAVYLLVATLMAVAGAAWVTDGFTAMPSWMKFARQYNIPLPVDSPQDVKEYQEQLALPAS